jgi:hypothetical protein
MRNSSVNLQARQRKPVQRCTKSFYQAVIPAAIELDDGDSFRAASNMALVVTLDAASACVSSHGINLRSVSRQISA